MTRGRVNIRGSKPCPFPVSANETDTDGAFRALGVLSWLEENSGRIGPTMTALRRAVTDAILSGVDSENHFRACRLGASVSALSTVPEYARIFSELPARDAEDSKDFWHDEILLFVASQLRAVGIPLVPLAREVGKRDPDAFAPPNLFVEVKHRPASMPNTPRDLGNFMRKALRADQIRSRDSAAIGIVVIDLGSHDTVNEDDFLPVDEAIYSELRRSGLLHAVIVSGMKREDPATWIFLSRGIQKRAALASGLCDQILRAFPYGTFVGTTELSNFGVQEDPPKT